MHHLLWIIPLCVWALAIWLITMIPAAVLAWIGGAFLAVVACALLGYALMRVLAEGMRS